MEYSSLQKYQPKYWIDNKDKNKQYRIDNKDRLKQYYIDNKDKFKQYYIDNKDNNKQYYKDYYIDNKDISQKYYIDNRDKCLSYQKEYNAYYKDDIKTYNRLYWYKYKSFTVERKRLIKLGNLEAVTKLKIEFKLKRQTDKQQLKRDMLQLHTIDYVTNNIPTFVSFI